MSPEKVESLKKKLAMQGTINSSEKKTNQSPGESGPQDNEENNFSKANDSLVKLGEENFREFNEALRIEREKRERVEDELRKIKRQKELDEIKIKSRVVELETKDPCCKVC